MTPTPPPTRWASCSFASGRSASCGAPTRFGKAHYRVRSRRFGVSDHPRVSEAIRSCPQIGAKVLGLTSAALHGVEVPDTTYRDQAAAQNCDNGRAPGTARRARSAAASSTHWPGRDTTSRSSNLLALCPCCQCFPPRGHHWMLGANPPFPVCQRGSQQGGRVVGASGLPVRTGEVRSRPDGVGMIHTDDPLSECDEFLKARECLVVVAGVLTGSCGTVAEPPHQPRDVGRNPRFFHERLIEQPSNVRVEALELGPADTLGGIRRHNRGDECCRVGNRLHAGRHPRWRTGKVLGER